MQDFQLNKEFTHMLFLIELADPSIEKNRGWHIRKKLDLKLMKKGATKTYWELMIFQHLDPLVVMLKVQLEQ